MIPAGKITGRVNGFVRCGGPLPGHEVAIRDDQGRPLPDLHVGRIKVRGPSVMSGYFAQPEQTRQALSPDGWLDTGDIGYLVDGSIVVTGRHKDMIIINGRNIWPQDIEHIAERQPELRSMDASAFFVLGEDDEEVAVAVVQCNINDAAESRAAHPAAAPRDPRGARHLLPDRARAAAHAAAHVLRQAVARRGARGLPAAPRAGTQSRARRRRQAVGYGEQASLPATVGLLAAASVARGLGRARPSVRSPPVSRATVPSLVALTGATGFIGECRTFAPHGAGWRVRALYRPRAGRTPPDLPARRMGRGRSRATTIRCARSWPARTPSCIVPALSAAPGARRFDRINAEGAARPRPGRRAAAARAAIPADVLPRGARARAVALRRQQTARRNARSSREPDAALDGAAPSRGLRAGRARARARSFAGSRAASRRLPAGARRALLAPLRRRSRDGGAALARRRHR